MSSLTGGAHVLKTYLGRTYELVRPFWQSEHRKTAWFLLLTILVIEGCIVYVMARMSYAYADLFDAMDVRNVDKTWWYLGLYAGLFGINLLLRVFNVHFRNLLIIHWRRYLTKTFLTDYLYADLYNQLELKDYKLDNPDQRISQDMYNVANETLELGVEFLIHVAQAVTFGVILWQVSGVLEFQLAGYDVAIPGYMFWVAFVYTVLMSWLAHRAAHPMARLNFALQAVEADFRRGLIRLRENAEAIALLRGEAREADGLQRKFGSIWDNWMELLRYRRRLIAVVSAQAQFVVVLPYVAAMPAFIAGSVTLGGFMQISLVFTNFQFAVTWFVNSYERLAVWKSSVDRVITLQDALQTAGEERAGSRIKWRSGGQPEFEVHDLTVDLPHGERLLKDIRLSLEPGQNIVVTGPSGSGKSTLFKALSSLWMWGEGEVRKPDGSVMFVPQKPYLPIGTLRDILAYPKSPQAINDVRLREVMQLCLLGQLAERLDESCDWARVLSGGEQQRLSFVRAILAKPDWLFLDEATAALDSAAEAAVYDALKAELPHTTLVSIAHRESLKKFHDLELRIDPAAQSTSIGALQPA